MQNTKTEYSSSERTPVVLPEMEQLLPPLNVEQFSAFESDLLKNEILPRDWRLHER